MTGTDTAQPTLFGPHLPLILLGTSVHRQESLRRMKDGRIKIYTFWTVHGEKSKFKTEEVAVQAAYDVLYGKLMRIS